MSRVGRRASKAKTARGAAAKTRAGRKPASQRRTAPRATAATAADGGASGARPRIAPTSALVAASLAMCLAGLLGVDGGIIWIVVGVLTARSLAGALGGLGWAIAFAGAGLRWGTLGLGDIAVSTRLFGPTVSTGTVLVRGGMVLALAAALIDEARTLGLAADSWALRGAAAGAVVALAPAFILGGATGAASLWQWGLGSAGLTAAVLALAPIARRAPGWSMSVVAVAAVAVAELAS